MAPSKYWKALNSHPTAAPAYLSQLKIKYATTKKGKRNGASAASTRPRHEGKSAEALENIYMTKRTL